MTYGEKMLIERENVDPRTFCAKNASFPDLPPRMSKEDTIRYYNEKLRKYWLSQMEHFGKQKEKALDYLTGRTAA